MEDKLLYMVFKKELEEVIDSLKSKRESEEEIIFCNKLINIYEEYSQGSMTSQITSISSKEVYLFFERSIITRKIEITELSFLKKERKNRNEWVKILSLLDEYVEEKSIENDKNCIGGYSWR